MTAKFQVLILVLALGAAAPALAQQVGTTTAVNPSISVTTGSVTTVYTQVQVQKTYQVLSVPFFFNMLQVPLSGEALMRNETSD